MARHPRMLAAAIALVLAAAVAGCTRAQASAQPRESATWTSPSASASTATATSPSASPSGTASHTPGTPPTSKPPAKPPTSPTKPPSGTATGKGPYGSMATTGSSAVALTFDDGPGPYTSQILDLLERNHIKATFCMIGRQVHSYPNEIKRMVADGDTLCNHTWDHDEQLRTRTDAQIQDELQKTNDAIHAIVPGAKIQYFRNPGGNFGPNTVAIGQSLGMKPLYWSVDPRDWSNPGTQSIINTVNSKTRAGSIVLSHDGGGDRSQTVAAYRTLLPGLKARFTLIPLPVS
jgi:peptidoglycan-N-acetylglucosamine deacetylase